MGIAGKYDFKGIKKYGAKGLIAALASTTWGAWVALPWVSPFFDLAFQFLANWLANKGLVMLNIAAIAVDGEWTQKDFDSAIDNALNQVAIPGSKLTPDQMKAIDDKVIQAFKKFAIMSGAQP